jgi:putative cell wall-binding protein
VTTASTTNPATFTLSGLKLDASATAGGVTAKVGTGGCGNTDIANNAAIAAIGSVRRIQGGDRYATAEKLFEEIGPCPINDVIVATGTNFPDALAASYLAGVHQTGILLVERDSIPSATSNGLRLRGVKNVFIIGGPAAVSTAVENALKNAAVYDCAGAATATKLTVTRVSGADRYATAKAVAEHPGLGAAGVTEPGLDASGSSPCGDPVKTAIVASGENFPDALAAGGAAARGAFGTCHAFPGGGSLPLLLTTASTLSDTAEDALVDLDIKQVILMGGPVAVSPAVQTAIEAANGGIEVIRVAGTNRQDTARRLAVIAGNPMTFAFASQGDVFVARGDAFPDALAAGPLAGRQAASSFLSDSPSALGAPATAGIANLSKVTGVIVDTATLVGGTAALSDAVGGQVAGAMASQS